MVLGEDTEIAGLDINGLARVDVGLSLFRPATSGLVKKLLF